MNYYESIVESYDRQNDDLDIPEWVEILCELYNSSRKFEKKLKDYSS